jgi:hypothetical protein
MLMKSVVRNIKTNRNPFILFLPFLILYILLILFFSKNENYGDESRYLMYAQNLVHGFYSPPPPDIDLGNGPGYPLLLVPFVALHIPVIYIKLLNALFYYLSIIFFFKSLQQFVTFKSATVFSIIWALYPSLYESLPYTLPEVFASFLIPLLVFTLVKSFKNGIRTEKRKYYMLFAGLSFGYLALTKPIFGYVIITMMVGMGLLWITNRKNTTYKKSISILIIAFISTVPYLAYTHHLTGKMFYWSSYGGNNLYWMSSPYEKEYGSWAPNSNRTSDFKDQESNIIGYADSIIKYHNADFAYVNQFKGVEHDEAYKRIAIQNIKSHPIKFLKNCLSNFGRIVFNYPYSYKIQNPGTLFRIPFNGTILLLMLFCGIPGIIYWKKINFSLRFMLLFALIYLGGSLLGSAETRMFTLIVPIFLFWIAFILSRSRIKFKFD